MPKVEIGSDPATAIQQRIAESRDVFAPRRAFPACPSYGGKGHEWLGGSHWRRPLTKPRAFHTDDGDLQRGKAQQPFPVRAADLGRLSRLVGCPVRARHTMLSHSNLGNHQQPGRRKAAAEKAVGCFSQWQETDA